MKKILAIIPARGGSKGVKLKNLKELNGKPLIAWTIEEARKSRYIDRLIVSTENSAIADTARAYGAEIPFLRPAELAIDHTPGMEPVLHCVEWLERGQGYCPDYVILLQCTSPIRKVRHIDEAIRMMLAGESQADSLLSVCRVEQPPFWMHKIREDGLMEDFMQYDRTRYARRQDMPEVYSENGAIYMAKTAELIRNKDFQTPRTLPYVMNSLSSLDIDSDYDFKLAKFIMNEGEMDDSLINP